MLAESQVVPWLRAYLIERVNLSNVPLTCSPLIDLFIDYHDLKGSFSNQFLEECRNFVLSDLMDQGALFLLDRDFEAVSKQDLECGLFLASTEVYKTVLAFQEAGIKMFAD